MKKGYSKYIIPIAILLDLLIINSVTLFGSDANYSSLIFIVYINFTWLLTSYYFDFYKVKRSSKSIKIASKLITQFIAFFIAFFAFFGIFREGEIVNNQLKIFLSILIGVTIAKIIYFYLLKVYRKRGLNYRKVVVIGSDPTSKRIIKIFKNQNSLGYQFKGFFSDKKSNSKDFLGSIEESYAYIVSNQIDEIFCSIASLKENQLKKIKQFAVKNAIAIKLIPESDLLYSKNMNVEYYDNTLILDVRKLPLEIIENRIIKRVFDILFSLLMFIFVLSWLTPILGLLIKLDSKGTVFFKQTRRGLSGNTFLCYKFRSMEINKESDQIHTTKDDQRITKLGTFIRRTSLDELPQFYNVLKGDMSVVGPRPHMKLQSLKFEEVVDNYIDRNAIKPGVTGLSQVSGYRGEIIKKSDIENRVRLDIFYIENWSFFLDIKIVAKTILNIFKFEAKAY